jgi:hypothetical protein
MSPDLLPDRQDSVQVRLRFYELAFEALGPPAGGALAAANGKFKEAAIGFPCRRGDQPGEVSLFLWSDSEVYMLWAREAFGFPVRLADIKLEGTLWNSAELAGTTGNASAQDGWGRASVADVHVSGPAQAPPVGAKWFTPRRTLCRAGLDGDIRELLLVKPGVRNAGNRYVGSARVSFEFAADHPLASLGEYEAEVDIADGIELVVGADVDLV